jgi:non-homologous end joining protein Ku
MIKKSKTRPGRGADQFIVRMPSGMRDTFAKLAAEHGRSMNAEILYALVQYTEFSKGSAEDRGVRFTEVGLSQISKRLEAGVEALEQLFFDARDRRVHPGSEQIVPPQRWRGSLQLSLVTCPVAFYPTTTHAKTDSLAVDIEQAQSHTIEILKFVPRVELDPRYTTQPYYIAPDGKVGLDAFAVIRETIRTMNKVAIGRVVLTNREHIVALEPLGKGLMGTLLRYPYEVRSEKEYFEDIQDVKISKDMLDLAKHIVEAKSGHFEPNEFEDYYNKPLIEHGKANKPDRLVEPAGNVISLMDALRKSVA